MGWGFWAILFLIFMLVTPAAQLIFVWARQQRARRALERARKTRVIPIILDMQTVATYGLPVARFEQLPLQNEVERAIRATPQDRPIDLVVDLPAGVVFDTAPVAEALAAHAATTTLIVPRHALVGGIALARAADAVILGPAALVAGDTADPAEGEAGSRAAADVGACGRAEPAEPMAGTDELAGDAQPNQEAKPQECRLPDLMALGLPATEGVPAAASAYLARFREPQRPRHALPFYMAQPRAR